MTHGIDKKRLELTVIELKKYKDFPGVSDGLAIIEFIVNSLVPLESEKKEECECQCHVSRKRDKSAPMCPWCFSNGCEKKEERCTKCNGSGQDVAYFGVEILKCTYCNGTGKEPLRTPRPYGVDNCIKVYEGKWGCEEKLEKTVKALERIADSETFPLEEGGYKKIARQVLSELKEPEDFQTTAIPGPAAETWQLSCSHCNHQATNSYIACDCICHTPRDGGSSNTESHTPSSEGKVKL